MKNSIKLFAIFIIIMGIILLSADKVYSYKNIEINNKKIEEYFIKKQNTKTEKYIGILEIPKINLKRGFYNPKSIHNNIDENIAILNPVELPDQKNSTMIIAAHSGNSHVSYFKNLHRLTKEDTIYIYYKNNKYEYRIKDYYEENKNGRITIKDNNIISKLILTTCKSHYKQLTYIAYLIKITK